MSGKLPIDRAREAQDAPAIYDEHRERFAEQQAELAARKDPQAPPPPGTTGDHPEGVEPLLRDHLDPADERGAGTGADEETRS